MDRFHSDRENDITIGLFGCGGSMPKKLTPENQIDMASDAALIYFCGEKLIRDIASSDLRQIEPTLQKTERAITNMRDWLKRVGH